MMTTGSLLAVAHLVNKFLLHMETEFHHRDHKILPLEPAGLTSLLHRSLPVPLM